MYKPIKDLITGKTPLEVDAFGNAVDRNLKLAVVGLLWEMVQIDGKQAPLEFLEVIRSIDHEFHLVDEESGELIQLVDFLRRQTPQFERFIAEVDQNYSPEQRAYLFDLVWKVAKADGFIAPQEREFANLLRTRLGLPVEDLE